MKKFYLHEISEENQREDLITSLCKSDSIEISISYHSDFRNAKILREFVDSLCKAYGVNPKWRTRLVLIIDELNNNAIEYGSKKDDENFLCLKLLKQDDIKLSVEASVLDQGTGEHAKNSQAMEELRKKHENKDFSTHNSIRGR